MLHCTSHKRYTNVPCLVLYVSYTSLKSTFLLASNYEALAKRALMWHSV